MSPGSKAKQVHKTSIVCGLCKGTNFEFNEAPLPKAGCSSLPEDEFCPGCEAYICMEHGGMPMGVHEPADHDDDNEEDDIV